MMIWFKVEKVEYPSSEEPPQGKPVLTLYSMVMEKDDIPFYRLFKSSSSIIDIYDMHNYFLARQYVYDKRTDAKVLYAEYHLTLTYYAKKIVDELLSKPFKCEVRRDHPYSADYLYYACTTEHPVYIPDPDTGYDIQRWYVTVYITRQRVNVAEWIPTSIPFNCGPLYPLWERAVECWIDKIAADIGPKHDVGLLNNIRHELLERKYIRTHIIPTYYI